MKIEFGQVDSELVVKEAIIRQCALDMLDKQNLADCFQARVESDTIGHDDSICCSFFYYSKSGEFLGLDTDSIWCGELETKSPYSLSCSITLPENTEWVKCQLGIIKCKKGVWDYAWPVFVILVFVLLISAIINLWR